MPEQELNPSASKFISSLVKSLQIICNGHVDFDESIELVGHINVRIDHKFKYNYIVDEHVSKEGEDCSTTFLSNSYHSSPPSLHKDDHSQGETDLSLTSLPAETCKPQRLKSSGAESTWQSDNRSREGQMYAVNVKSPKGQTGQHNPMVFKMESGDDSGECMMLPITAEEYDPDINEAIAPCPSGSTDDTVGGIRAQKRRRNDLEGSGDVQEADTVETKVTKKRTMPKRNKAKFPKPTLVNTKPKKFTNPEELRRIDQLWNKSGATYHCSECPYNTTYRNRVRAHCRSVHMGIPRKYKGNEKGYFVCDKCGKEFTSSRGFRMHMLSKHLNQFPYQCEQCSKGFLSVSTHRDHMNMHAGIALQCLGCETLFYTEYGLKRHLLKKHPELL